MQQQTVRYRSALAVMKALGTTEMADVTQDDLKWLQDDALITHTHRARLRTVLENIVYSGCDYAGIIRSNVPAEFVAGAILEFVSPSNWMICCETLGTTAWTENIIRNNLEPVGRDQLFAFLVQVAGTKEFIDHAQSNQEKRLEAGKA
jgi:hypothetical protein